MWHRDNNLLSSITVRTGRIPTWTTLHYLVAPIGLCKSCHCTSAKCVHVDIKARLQSSCFNLQKAADTTNKHTSSFVKWLFWSFWPYHMIFDEKSDDNRAKLRLPMKITAKEWKLSYLTALYWGCHSLFILQIVKCFYIATSMLGEVVAIQDVSRKKG